MRLKEETAVVAHNPPIPRTIGHSNGTTTNLGLLRSGSLTDDAPNQTAALNGTQWITNYETQATTDNHVVISNCPERHQQYSTSNTLDNVHSGGGIVADGNSNGVVVPTLEPNQVEAALRAGRLLVTSEQVTAASRNVVLVPIACSPGDTLLNSAEETQLPSLLADDDEDSSEDSSSSTCSASSSTSLSGSALSEEEGDGEQTRRQRLRALRRPRAGILNPNYPGFQRYANRLQLEYDGEEDEEEEEEEGGGEERRTTITRNINNAGQADAAASDDNNNNNNDLTPAMTTEGHSLNQLDGVVERFDKSLSCEGVATLNIPPVGVEGEGKEEGERVQEEVVNECSEKKERNMEGGWASHPKMADAHLSGTRDEVSVEVAGISVEEEEVKSVDATAKMSASPQVGMCKKEKMEVNRGIRAVARDTAVALTPSQKALAPAWAQQVALRREQQNRHSLSRRSMPEAKERTKRTSPDSGGFDVYNIETAMPSIDLDAIESHLRAAEERRRRNDREEIRRRLAMGPEADDCFAPGRKPSLQSRLQSGMNLQICFMNETLSDGESPSGSDDSPSPPLSSSLPSLPHPLHPSSRDLSSAQTAHADNMAKAPPRTLSLKSSVLSSCHGGVASSLPVGGVVGKWDVLGSSGSEQPQSLKAKWEGEDFFGRQARLQAEARVALAQAKEMAHMQMEVERQRLKANSPITQMVRASLLKVGLVFPVDRRRVSRQMLTEMNVAQLQVIVNDLHTQIEVLNEDLVKLLMERDDLHMEQDSMLVDIEDLTRYLGAKEKALKESGRDPGSGSTRGGEAGAVGSLPSLPLIFRHNSKLSSQSNRQPKVGLLSKK
ncbi:uncharacterized protein LOC124168478 [Ischnura elegans]|uniref:uncharacterized protein LOC124168478 n=1 Tax=Ischnura elegans TaxID=197161 RepID=UPI001ED8700B|nr:uncharacterized protein LOC124168478 [Ischnura elegans]XP_046402713.1 uncharacterized protein LOC124168478 [Ischnura elegans]XP_046402714.1 uncharacterized protein LOC124168478 [Ischnura elegans]